jgi:hypothetical protein
MRFVMRMVLILLCIGNVLKMCGWTGNLEFYVRGGQHGIE